MSHPFVFNIDKLTVENTDYRRVIHTSAKQQLVLMSLKPGEEIGMEVHPQTDQFIRIEQGSGVVVFDKNPAIPYEDDFAILIPAGTQHNIVNTSTSEFTRLYTIYSPPHHEQGTVQKNKPEESEE